MQNNLKNIEIKTEETNKCLNPSRSQGQAKCRIINGLKTVDEATSDWLHEHNQANEPRLLLEVYWKTVFALINTSWIWDLTLQTIISSRTAALTLFCLFLRYLANSLPERFLSLSKTASSTSEVILCRTASSWTTSEVNPKWGSYFSPTATELCLVSFVSGARLHLGSEV